MDGWVISDLKKTAIGTSVEIKKDGVPWWIKIRSYGDYDSAFKNRNFSADDMIFITKEKWPALSSPDMYLKDKHLHTIIHLSRIGSIEVEDIDKHVSELQDIKSCAETVESALKDLFPGPIEN